MTEGGRMVPWAVVLVVLGAVTLHATTDNETFANACYLVVLVGASVGAWFGAARAPVGRRLVPVLIASGVSLSALGDVLGSVLELLGAATDVSIADVPWFASYVALSGALWVVVRRTRPSGEDGRRVDVNLSLDVVTIVVVISLVFWGLAIDRIIDSHSMTPVLTTVWAMYGVADAVLLALAVRLMLSRRSRAGIPASFAAGLVLLLAADFAYLQPTDVIPKMALDVAYMVAPVLLAWAAWAAWRAGRPQALAPGSSTPRRWVGTLIIAVAPLSVPPVLELVAQLRGQGAQPLQLFVGMAVLSSLAFIRTARLLRSEESALDAALEASRAKTLFVANMSHEIRTPLTTVLATAELLEDTSLDDLQLQLLTKMNRSGVLLKSLVEAILDFSRIEAGQLKLNSTTFDLHAMLADAADTYRSRAVATGIRFACSLEPGVPRSVVGDAARLFQVLSNLLDNALKFTHEGEVGLVTRCTQAGRSNGAGDGVEFIVSDTGIGLAEQDQELVFDSFHQVDGSTTRRYGGNGLGLAICKELTELMGGSITLQSQLGVGSTFVVHMPLTRADTDPEPTSILAPFPVPR